MNGSLLTQHASTRLTQRGIPRITVDLLLEYGELRRIRDAEIYFFSKESRKRLHRDLGRDMFNRLGKLLNTYAVVQEGRVVTVAYRDARIPNQ